MRIVFKFLASLFFLFLFFFGYLSLIGIETKKFNNQISNKIKEFDQHLNIELKNIKIIFNPIDFTLISFLAVIHASLEINI